MKPRDLLHRALPLCALPCLLLPVSCSSPSPPIASTTSESIQGHWEAEDERGKTSITIDGSSLHFFEREDHWFETSFTLPSGTGPQQLRATIEKSSGADTAGQVVLAILKIEDGILTLATDGGPDEPPASFEDAMNHYELAKVQPPPGK